MKTMLTFHPNDPIAVAVGGAIRRGELDSLKRLLHGNPALATAMIGSRSLLHVAADWPGHFPNGAATVSMLIAAGADPNARPPGEELGETPLHWAASSDDVAVLDALIDGGADMEAMGASIAGGTPLDDAVGYGQWNVARRLVERGAHVGRLWHAAALGLMDLVERFFAAQPSPTPEEINSAFWQACHGGQLPPAEYLIQRGADINWQPTWANDLPFDMAEQSGNQNLIEWLNLKGAKSSKQTPD